jgi:DNA-binding GntR family transcriptional regulator
LTAFVDADESKDAIGRLTSTGRFYDVMLRGCGNAIIRELLQGLVARINFLRARSMSRPGRARYSATEMRRILRAIEKNDAAGARGAAVAHVHAACAAAEIVFEPRRAA